MTRRESTAAEEAITGLKFFYRPGATAESPVVVLVHGRAGNRGVMWTFERSIPESCHVVAFEAFLHDPLGGWSWWEMTTPGSKREAIVYAAHKLRTALQGFLEHHALQPSSLMGLGFSQGSVLVSAAVSLQLISFDAIGVLAGFVFLPDEGVRIGKLPSVFVAHGTQDDTVSVTKARRGVEALRALGADVQYVEEDVGHKVGIEGSRALKQWVLQRVST
jgi:phospholipase/carboxylesterase